MPMVPILTHHGRSLEGDEGCRGARSLHGPSGSLAKKPSYETHEPLSVITHRLQLCRQSHAGRAYARLACETSEEQEAPVLVAS